MIERREGKVERRQKGKGEKREEREKETGKLVKRREGERIEREKMIRLLYMRERDRVEENGRDRGMNIEGEGNNIEILK